MKIIGFLVNKITLRGTEIAMYDYAEFNEILLNNKSIIITRDYNNVNNERDADINAYLKFKNRFTLEYYYCIEDINNIVDKYNISHLYIIKEGRFDGLITNKCKNLIHCVFNTREPHGEIYSTISNDVNRICKTNYPVVPHMIRVSNTNKDMRIELNIPKNAIVFGRYGGLETFDIDFVYDCIKKILSNRDDIYFIFMNTNKFYENKNIIYLNGNVDMNIKREFINTSDALLHARKDGESFGLTCGEFAICLKPVIVYKLSNERNHLDILQDKAITYTSFDELYDILNNFTKDKYDMRNNGYLEYTPDNVMDIFNKIYLN